MNKAPRNFALALITAVLASFQTQAGTVSIPRVNVGVSLGAAAAVPLFNAGSLTGSASLAPSSILPLMPMLSALPAPIALTPVPALAAVRPAAISPSVKLVGTPAQRIAPVLAALEVSADSRGNRGHGGAGFDGARARGTVPVDDYIVNDEGVKISGRSAKYYREIKRLQAALAPLDLRESLDVMDDTYHDVWGKLAAVEAIAKQREVSAANVHLEETLTFVDGMISEGDRNIAVHTHHVFFHKADNAASEIGEGIRRVDAYLEQAERHFTANGEAEVGLNAKLDEVQLAFDTRGYAEIKAHLRVKEGEFRRKYGDRFRFSYVDELARIPQGLPNMRAAYNQMVEKYKDQPLGLQKIIEGVTYSRYVGVLLELKTLQYKMKRGYKVLQSGRDLFDESGKYVTEGDGVVVSPRGEFEWIEAKSARVYLPPEEVLRDKVLYKLDVYKKNLALLEKTVGGKLKFVFSFDVGGRDPKAARQGMLVWKDPRQQALMEYLEAQAPLLSEKYGFPVSFLFLNSQPGEDPLLYQQKPVDAKQWEASQMGGSGKGSGRKHGRAGGR